MRGESPGLGLCETTRHNHRAYPGQHSIPNTLGDRECDETRSGPRRRLSRQDRSADKTCGAAEYHDMTKLPFVAVPPIHPTWQPAGDVGSLSHAGLDLIGAE